MESIEDLPKGTNFYEGEASHGGLIIRRDLVRGSSVIGDFESVAVALTEFCCETGFGKVYSFSRIAHNGRNTVTDFNVAYPAFAEVADLMYRPWAWSENEKHEWKSMFPKDRVDATSAHLSDIADGEYIIPISLLWEREDYQETYLSGWTMAPVSIAIIPQPYIGDTTEMRDALNGNSRTWRKRQGAPDDRNPVPQFEGPKNNLERFKVAGGMGIIEWLKDNYFEGPERVKEYIQGRTPSSL